MMTPPNASHQPCQPPHNPGVGLILACFDSGLGGVVFLHHVLQQWPDCPVVFVADTAWIPYGDKPPVAIASRVDAIYRWLLNTYPSQLSAFALACNTSVGAALTTLQATQADHHETHAMLHPVGATLRALKPEYTRIGVLATAATIQAQTYQNAIQTTYPDATITAIACPGWVDLIEAGQHLVGDQVIPLIQPVCDALKDANVDVVILGCTHYGLLSPWLSQALGANITLLDSAQCLAQHVVETYKPAHDRVLPPATQRLLCTQDALGFKTRMAQFGFNTLCGLPVDDLTAEMLLGEAIPEAI